MVHGLAARDPARVRLQDAPQHRRAMRDRAMPLARFLGDPLDVPLDAASSRRPRTSGARRMTRGMGIEATAVRGAHTRAPRAHPKKHCRVFDGAHGPAFQLPPRPPRFVRDS
jgi:hypothetical protein